MSCQLKPYGDLFRIGLLFNLGKVFIALGVFSASCLQVWPIRLRHIWPNHDVPNQFHFQHLCICMFMLRSCIPMPINLLKSPIALQAFDNDLASFTTNRKFKHRSIALNCKLGYFANEKICAASSKANCLSWNSTFRDSDVLPGKTVAGSYCHNPRASLSYSDTVC